MYWSCRNSFPIPNLGKLSDSKSQAEARVFPCQPHLLSDSGKQVELPALCGAVSGRLHPAQKADKEGGEGALPEGECPRRDRELFFLVRTPATVSKNHVGEMSYGEKNVLKGS